jgi:hypothetical protein
MSSCHTNHTLEIANEMWRAGKELHPFRVLLIGPSKILKYYNDPSA